MPASFTLTPAVVGDKWGGQAIGPVMNNGVLPTFPLARVRFEFFRRCEVGMVLDSDGSGDYLIDIASPATWFFYLPEIQPIPLADGGWNWSAKFYEEGATSPQTLIYGVLTVIN